MRRTAIVALLLLAQACSQPPARDGVAAQVREIDALAAAAMAQRGIPGLAVVVLHRDQVLVQRGYGRESLARTDAVTPRTTFVHNSIGKTFAAAMTLALEEDGTLGLDDPVVSHLPDMTLLPPALTVRHLLSHSSGVREAGGVPELWKLLETPDATMTDVRAALRSVPVDWAPGSRWSYSNTNYALLQVLIEELADRPLIALYEARFFRPHGLDSMRVCPFLLDDTRGHAIGHAEREGKLVRAEGVNNVASLAQGGLCGSALDLARFVRLLATGRIVGADSYARMTTPTRLDDGSEAGYGFGLGLVPQDGVRRAGHSGIGFGYSSSVGYYPDAELTIVVLANRFGYPDAIERQIARRLLALPEPDRGDAGITPAQRRAWVGRYDVGMFGWTPRLFERDGRLWFELFGPDTSYALIRTRDGWLLPETVPDAMRFRLEETPSGVRLRMQTMGTQDWSGPRTAD